MKHISIEGMDGVGKTTTCRLLAQKTGYEFIEKNLRFLFDENNECDNYFRIRDKVNANCNRLFTSWFYGLGNIYLYEQFHNRKIITDRHFLSNYAWSGTEDNTEVYDLLVKKLGFPTMTFILFADEESISQRLVHRDETDSDLCKVQLAKAKYKKMVAFCDKYKMPYVLIDTSKLTPKETVDRILSELKGVI